VSRLLWLLALLAAVIAAGQVAVPGLVGQSLGRALARVTGPGSRDRVEVVAVPFWMLAEGRFQALSWQVTGWHVGPLTVRTVHVDWSDGGINVPDLVRDRSLVITNLGRMSIRMAVDGPALARLLAASGRIHHPVVTVGSRDITLAGDVSLNGLNGHVTARGTLAVSPDGRRILFRPVSVDGIGLPFPAEFVVFDVSRLNVPVPLVIRALRLEPPSVVVWLETP
jgi:hypothetical protein